MPSEAPETFIEEDFIDSLPEEPSLAALQMCQHFFTRESEWLSKEGLISSKVHASVSTLESSAQWHKAYIRSYAILQAFSETHDVGIDFPNIDGRTTTDIERIRATFDSAQTLFIHKVTNLALAQEKARFSRIFSGAFVYEFSDGDVKQIQHLINELREQISTSELFEEDHRRRLLKRLEKLQAELHKKMADIDRFWGLVGDASVMLRKFGEDAKPIVDRIKELSEIVWRTQARAEELPSDSKSPALEHLEGE